MNTDIRKQMDGLFERYNHKSLKTCGLWYDESTGFIYVYTLEGPQLMYERIFIEGPYCISRCICNPINTSLIII